MRWSLMMLALIVASPALGQGARAGIDAWSRGDYPGAVAAWRPLAAKGDADAQFNLAQAYRLGRGVPVDLPQAMDLYTRAASAGHADAQTQLGILLFQNGNQLSGLRWLRQAADKGEPRAQLLYGTALFNGDGLLTRDPEAAYRYVARAAAQGLAPAKTTLADMDQAIPADVRRRALGGVTAPAKAIGPARRSAKPAVALASPAPPAATATGGWRVQLGAFGQRAAAETLFRRLAAGPLAGKQPFLVPVGAVTRLQAGPYPTRAAASAACAALAARGQACFAVPGR